MRDYTKSLTAQEFHSILGNLIANGQIDPDQKVEIQTADFSIGPHAGEGVCAVVPGFDWDQGRLFLIPQKDLILKLGQGKIDKGEKDT